MNKIIQKDFKGLKIWWNFRLFDCMCEVMGLDFLVYRKKKSRTLVPFFFHVSISHSILRRYRSYSIKSVGDQCADNFALDRRVSIEMYVYGQYKFVNILSDHIPAIKRKFPSFIL